MLTHQELEIIKKLGSDKVADKKEIIEGMGDIRSAFIKQALVSTHISDDLILYMIERASNTNGRLDDPIRLNKSKVIINNNLGVAVHCKRSDDIVLVLAGKRSKYAWVRWLQNFFSGLLWNKSDIAEQVKMKTQVEMSEAWQDMYGNDDEGYISEYEEVAYEDAIEPSEVQRRESRPLPIRRPRPVKQPKWKLYIDQEFVRNKPKWKDKVRFSSVKFIWDEDKGLTQGEKDLAAQARKQGYITDIFLMENKENIRGLFELGVDGKLVYNQLLKMKLPARIAMEVTKYRNQDRLEFLLSALLLKKDEEEILFLVNRTNNITLSSKVGLKIQKGDFFFYPKNVVDVAILLQVSDNVLQAMYLRQYAETLDKSELASYRKERILKALSNEDGKLVFTKGMIKAHPSLLANAKDAEGRLAIEVALDLNVSDQTVRMLLEHMDVPVITQSVRRIQEAGHADLLIEVLTQRGILEKVQGIARKGNIRSSVKKTVKSGKTDQIVLTKEIVTVAGDILANAMTANRETPLMYALRHKMSDDIIQSLVMDMNPAKIAYHVDMIHKHGKNGVVRQVLQERGISKEVISEHAKLLKGKKEFRRRRMENSPLFEDAPDLVFKKPKKTSKHKKHRSDGSEYFKKGRS